MNKSKKEKVKNNEMIKDTVIAQLTDLFGEFISNEVITTICKHTNFNLQNAIERLISLSENDHNRAEKKADEDDFLIESETITQSTPNVVNSGAIRKQMGGPTSSFYPPQQYNYRANNNNRNKPRENNNNLPDNFEKICTLIRENLKVLTILRGLPGSGKSTLAKNIVKSTIGPSGGDNYILSADDYFLDRHGRYFYEQEKIGEAHEFTQNRAIKRMQQGWSPIIVDNTNMKVWEMIPYVKMAVTYGYIIKILEPTTSWARVPRLLAKKNTHQVPEAKLRRMLETYEPANVRNILRSLQMEFHMDALPQLRDNPAFDNKYVAGQEENVITATATPMNVRDIFSNYTFNNNTSDGHQIEWTEKWNEETTVKDDIDMTIDEASKRLNLSDIPLPKPPRFLDTPKATPTTVPEEVKKEEKLPEFTNVNWKSLENESTEFWNSHLPVQVSETTPQTLEKEKTKPQPRREVLKELPVPVVDTVVDTEFPDVDSQLVKHRKDCPNENPSFILIRTIYPQVPVVYLWDLYEKCNGDMEWTIDILLKDKSILTDYLNEDTQPDDFKCDCELGLVSTREKFSLNSLLPIIPASSDHQPNESNSNSPAMKQVKRDKFQTSVVDQTVKRAIEQNIVFGDEHYSDHSKKIRDFRRAGSNNNQRAPPDSVPIVQPLVDSETSSTADETEEIVEIELGHSLVNQLDSMFGVGFEENTSAFNLKTNVFMTKSLANQLYALWRESLYNQLEEQRIKSVKEDEEFAKQLHAQEKYPMLFQHDEPKNMKDMMEMELALAEYRAEMKETWQKSNSTDLATQLTRNKLSKLFPNVDKETLFEILAAHNNKFEETIELLSNSLSDGRDLREKLQINSKDLFEEARKESILIESSLTANIWTDKPDEKVINADEAKREALKDFEESRNSAMHHSQLKAECYLKAKNAVQRGETGVALYYSQIANLHKNKIDMYNHKAANCIMEVHNFTQNNPDMLDLHYLHLAEAIQCLDLFLDKHITKLKGEQYNCKNLFVITGRGLHSAGGIPTIKVRVKQRLKDRGLKFNEVNPGLLKVKIFTYSMYA